MLAAATIEGGRAGWTAPEVLIPYAIAALALVAFVCDRGAHARVRCCRSALPRPPFGAAAAIGLLLNIAVYGLIFVLSLFFQRVQGRTRAADRAGVRADDRRRHGHERLGGRASPPASAPAG